MTATSPAARMLRARVLWLALLAGCASAPEASLYLVDVSDAASFRLDVPMVQGISLRRVTSADYLQPADIFYQAADLKAGYYRLHRWVSAPKDMVEQSMMTALREANLARNVFSSTDRREAEVELELEVQAFGEHDRRDGDSVTVSGRVEIRLLGVDRRGSGAHLFEHRAAHEQPASERSHDAVVLAINGALRQCLSELVDRLRTELAPR